MSGTNPTTKTEAQFCSIHYNSVPSNISPFLGTTGNQFGFKADHSTDQCTFL